MKLPTPFIVSSVIEVERKFCSLAVPSLTANSGRPPFQSIQFLGQSEIHDVYFDKGKQLSTAGIWVRQRNGRWEAKVRRGGDFINSKFEELANTEDIARCVNNIVGTTYTSENNFGLKRIATISTIRRAWSEVSDFKITLDTMDFGHTVGEVELRQKVTFSGTSQRSIEQAKEQKMQEMDERISSFMQQYSWAFRSGEPKGKLTAFFEHKGYH
jgi:thiamine-triphosphatase